MTILFEFLVFLLFLSPLFLIRFTTVKEGTAKIVLLMGAYNKTLLTKRGYEVALDGEVVPITTSGQPPVLPSGLKIRRIWFLRWIQIIILQKGQALPIPPQGLRFVRIRPFHRIYLIILTKGRILFGGLHFVGIWPFHKIHTDTMKFVKALSQAKGGKFYEERSDEYTDFILARVDYQYALIIENAETCLVEFDGKGREIRKNGVGPTVSALIAMTARSKNPKKTFFQVGNWYDALLLRVKPKVREYFSEHSYEELIYGKDKLDNKVFAELGQVPPGEKRSIITILDEDYGLELIALEVVNIDPSEELRSATTRQWEAVQNAKAEAEETSGALDEMIDKRIERLAERLGLKKEEIKDYLAQNIDVLKEIEEQQLDLLRRDRAGRAGAGLRDIRVANADGSKLDPATATLMSLIELWKSEGSRSGGSGQRSGSSPKREGRKKKPEDMTDEELEDEAESDE